VNRAAIVHKLQHGQQIPQESQQLGFAERARSLQFPIDGFPSDIFLHQVEIAPFFKKSQQGGNLGIVAQISQPQGLAGEQLNRLVAAGGGLGTGQKLLNGARGIQPIAIDAQVGTCKSATAQGANGAVVSPQQQGSTAIEAKIPLIGIVRAIALGV